MLEITILASGSAGNSALIRSGNTTLLIDAGLSARRLRERLTACNVRPEALDGILLTHEHGDHTGALKVLCARAEIPIYANRMTATALGHLATHKNWRYFSSAAFSIGDLTIESFPVPHDAVEPVGFLVHQGESSFGLVTDLGHATPAICDRLRQVDALFIETNYDDDLLTRDLRRPWSVKQRILSQHGHLSNNAAAEIVAEVITDRLRRVLIGHLSRDCNTPELATNAITKALAAKGCSDIAVHCNVQDSVSPTQKLGAQITQPSTSLQSTFGLEF